METPKRILSAKDRVNAKFIKNFIRLLDLDGIRIDPWYVFIHPYQVIKVERSAE